MVTVDDAKRTAALRITWQGGAVTETTMTMNHSGGHARATDEDTVDLVRRLAEHYDDTTIAGILARQRRLTSTGLPFTRSRITSLRAARGIPAFRPTQNVGPAGEDVKVATITEAEKILGVGRATLYRGIREGFLIGEQLTPGAPRRIRIDKAVRDRLSPEVPEGWLKLADAARALGIASQTVLHKVQRGELQAVHVDQGRRKGLRINVKGHQIGVFDQP